jgi:hypothetical protein
VTDRGFAALARLPRLASLALGGRRLTDAAMATLVEAPALVDLSPLLFGDGAFVYIGRMPRLERLTNMYNRATTDAATRHLDRHPRLANYSAFGTQITDESLRILAGLAAIETVELENCAGITDAGLRELARSPRLRRLSVWSCMNVNGSWVADAAPGLEVKSEPGPPGHAAGYRFETLMDHPDLPMPADAATPQNASRSAGLLSTLTCFGGRAAFDDEGLTLSVDRATDTRWIGLITRDAFTVPVRIDLVVRPIAELRLIFGRHNSAIAFDAEGFVENVAPWFLQVEAQKGQCHRTAGHSRPGEWANVTLEIDERERRLFVDGALRHSWQDDFGGLRSRVGIGLRRSSLVVRELTVSAP